MSQERGQNDNRELSQLRAIGKEEAARFLADYGNLDVVEMLLPDTHSVIRGKWGPQNSLAKAFGDGIQLPLSIFGLDVWGREVPETNMHIETGDRDGMCLGIPGSIRPVPWAAQPTAQVLMSMYEADGTPWFADPRHVLDRVVTHFSDLGLTPTVAFELEFYLLRPDFESEAQSSPLPVTARLSGPERQRMYSIAELASLDPLFTEIRRAAEAQGLPVDTIISEAGPGQFEVNLNHKSDPLGAADDAVLLRRLITCIAQKHDMRASFMAKPFQEWPGNGMHIHISLADGAGSNAFAAGATGETLLRHAIAGALKTMPEALAVFINSFNGYRRLAPGSYAPTRATWGSNNRSVAIRIPSGAASARRLEHRISGADANPHLVLAGVLAGMLEGINQKAEPPAATIGNAYDGDGAELTDYMEEAVEAFETSRFVRDAFGVEFQRVFTALKKAEQAVFDERISRLEHETYL